jgi:hypothetical protein
MMSRKTKKKLHLSAENPAGYCEAPDCSAIARSVARGKIFVYCAERKCLLSPRSRIVCLNGIDECGAGFGDTCPNYKDKDALGCSDRKLIVENPPNYNSTTE